MRTYVKILLTACLVAVATSRAIAQNDPQSDPYKTPLYWSTYEYNIIRQHIGVCYNYVPESVLLNNINWVDANLKKFGYNSIEIDGWGDSQELNENGYRTTHSRLWQHDFAFWSAYLQSRGMRLGMYADPLWIHVAPSDTQTKIVGTNIPVSSLIENPPAPNPPSATNAGPSQTAATASPQASTPCGLTGQSPSNTNFTWIAIERPGAEQYIKGYIKFYADMGIKFLRVDFLPWYETGFDHYLGKVGQPHSHQDYVTALRWMREACDQYGMFLSLAMANLFNEGQVERQYAHMTRIDEDVDYGEWYKFSDKDRGHRFQVWSQWANAADGYTYWSYITGQNKMRLDGDFIRMNTYANDSERRTVISTHLMAGGPVGVTDQVDTIGDSIWVYQNPELIALNADDFVGHPLTNDPTNEASQIWAGRMSNGDGIVEMFNRELMRRTRSLTFSDVGFSGNVAVRDLWQHADMGQMSSLTVDLPPHGSIVVKLTQAPSTCRPQSITFDPIPDWNYPSPPPNVSATATSGLPVQFEIAFGPATVVNSQVQPTAQTGTVYVVARQPGDASNCAAIPQLQSFNATGIHQSEMFLFGTFTNWTPWRMKLVNGTWVGDKVWVPAGMQQYKFADTNNFTGADWGNGQGLSGTSTVTTGGGPNSQFTAPESGYYKVIFDDVALQFNWQLEMPANTNPPIP
jgi:hypothetical protein